MIACFRKYLSKRIVPLQTNVNKIAPEPAYCKNCSMCHFYGSCLKCNLTNK